jgi:succinate dehydrogenase hydrophobic anchor subunit
MLALPAKRAVQQLTAILIVMLVVTHLVQPLYTPENHIAFFCGKLQAGKKQGYY